MTVEHFGSPTIRFVLNDLPRRQLGRVLHRLRATLRRLLAEGRIDEVGLSAADAEMSDGILALFNRQFVSASEDARQHVTVTVRLDVGVALRWLHAVRRLSRYAADVRFMAELGAPPVDADDVVFIEALLEAVSMQTYTDVAGGPSTGAAE